MLEWEIRMKKLILFLVFLIMVNVVNAQDSCLIVSDENVPIIAERILYTYSQLYGEEKAVEAALYSLERWQPSGDVDSRWGEFRKEIASEIGKIAVKIDITLNDIQVSIIGENTAEIYASYSDSLDFITSEIGRINSYLPSDKTANVLTVLEEGKENAFVSRNNRFTITTAFLQKEKRDLSDATAHELGHVYLIQLNRYQELDEIYEDYIRVDRNFNLESYDSDTGKELNEIRCINNNNYCNPSTSILGIFADCLFTYSCSTEAGHPWDDTHEMFASFFMAYVNYGNKLRQLINSLEDPSLTQGPFKEIIDGSTEEERENMHEVLTNLWNYMENDVFDGRNFIFEETTQALGICLDYYSLIEDGDCWNQNALCIEGECIGFDNMDWDSLLLTNLKTATSRRILEDLPLRDRYDSIHILGKIKSEEAITLLGGILTYNIHGILRERAAISLEEVNSQRLTPILRRSLKSDIFDDVRYSVAISLGKIASPEAIQALREALRSDESSHVRGKIVKILGEIGSGEDVSLISNVLETDQSSLTKMEAARALGNIGTEEAFQALKRMFHSNIIQEDIEIVIAGELAKAEYDPEAIQYLVNIINSNTKTENINLAIIILSQSISPERAIPILQTALKTNQVESVRMAAATQLGYIASPEAIQALREALRSENSSSVKEIINYILSSQE